MVRNGVALAKPLKVLETHAPIKDMVMNKVKLHGVSYGLGEAGYDIRIKQNVHFYGGNIRRHVTYEAPFRGGKIEIGNFVIASTVEEFDMPNDLMAIVHDKSTWARKGLSVFNTVIEPGWKGFLTLELVYHGQEDLFIPAGSGIAQAIFHEVARPAVYAGKYQNQEDRPVEAILEPDKK